MIPPRRNLRALLRVFCSLDGDGICKRVTKVIACTQAIHAYWKSWKATIIWTPSEISTPLVPPYAEKYKWSYQDTKGQTNGDSNNNKITFINHSLVSFEIQTMNTSWVEKFGRLTAINKQKYQVKWENFPQESSSHARKHIVHQQYQK